MIEPSAPPELHEIAAAHEPPIPQQVPLPPPVMQMDQVDAMVLAQMAGAIAIPAVIPAALPNVVNLGPFLAIAREMNGFPVIELDMANEPCCILCQKIQALHDFFYHERNNAFWHHILYPAWILVVGLPLIACSTYYLSQWSKVVGTGITTHTNPDGSVKVHDYTLCEPYVFWAIPRLITSVLCTGMYLWLMLSRRLQVVWFSARFRFWLKWAWIDNALRLPLIAWLLYIFSLQIIEDGSGSQKIPGPGQGHGSGGQNSSPGTSALSPGHMPCTDMVMTTTSFIFNIFDLLLLLAVDILILGRWCQIWREQQFQLRAWRQVRQLVYRAPSSVYSSDIEMAHNSSQVDLQSDVQSRADNRSLQTKPTWTRIKQWSRQRIYKCVGCCGRNKRPGQSRLLSRTPSSEQLDAEMAGQSIWSTCSVCLTDFEDGETVCELQRCGHRFHRPCIAPWIDSDHHCCPNCRTVLYEDNR